MNLLQNRGLIIRDFDSAHNQLSNISYFRFASYLRSMEVDSITHQYRSGTTFEEVISLYLFDKELRKLIFCALQDIEVALRTKIIQRFSMQHGAFWFMDASLFADSSIYQNCLDSLKKEVSRSNEEFIREHKEKYESPQLPPVWKSLEVASFGVLSKLFCNFSDVEAKKAVAHDLGLSQYTYLESWIKCAVVLRNYCAHHARVWNRRFPLKPKMPARLPNKWLAVPQMRPQKLYHQLCYLLYLEQHITPHCDLRSEIFALIKSYPNVNLHSMGFPINWKEEPLWSK